MTVLGRGDLAPRRRPRRRGGRSLRVLGVLLVLAVLGYLGYHYLWLAHRHHKATAASNCVVVTPAAAPPAVADHASVHIRNGTKHDGLGRLVSLTFKQRGFTVLSVANGKADHGDPQVHYADSAALPAARLVGEQVPGSVLVADPGARGGVVLVIGDKFRRLASPVQAAAAKAHDLAAVKQATPTPYRSCSPHA